MLYTCIDDLPTSDARSLHNFFSGMQFVQKVRRPLALSSIRFLAIFRTFWVLTNPQDFLSKINLVYFLTLWLSNFKQKTRKNWWANSGILYYEQTNWLTNGRADGRTNRAKFIRNFHWRGCLTMFSFKCQGQLDKSGY